MPSERKLTAKQKTVAWLEMIVGTGLVIEKVTFVNDQCEYNTEITVLVPKEYKKEIIENKLTSFFSKENLFGLIDLSIKCKKLPWYYKYFNKGVKWKTV